jgi:AraC family transcriptional regulator
VGNAHLTIEGQIQSRDTVVQVRNYSPESDQLEALTAWPDYTLIRSLGPVSYSANTGASRFMGFGDIFLVPAGVPLRYRGLGGPYRHVTCRFDGLTFEHLAGLNGGWPDGLLDACRDIRAPQVNAALLRLAQETLAPSFASDILVESIASVLAVDLARHFRRETSDPPRAKGGLAPWQLRRIEQHANESPDTSLSIERLATLCGISSGHLMRAFRQTTGQTVHAYVEGVRLAKAQRLLCETNLPLKTIAAELGFSTPSSFSFAFRRATGGTPASFREQLRRMAPDPPPRSKTH